MSDTAVDGGLYIGLLSDDCAEPVFCKTANGAAKQLAMKHDLEDRVRNISNWDQQNDRGDDGHWRLFSTAQDLYASIHFIGN